MPADAPMVRLIFTVDDLAQEIRRVDGSNSLGAGALAEALSPFLIERLLAYAALSASPAIDEGRQAGVRQDTPATPEGPKPTGEQMVCGNDWQRRMLADAPATPEGLRQSPSVEEVARVIAPDAFDGRVPTGPRRVIHRNAMRTAQAIADLFQGRGG